MRQRTVNLRLELSPEDNLAIEKWADHEERSKRRHAAVLLRKLTVLRKTQPDKLAELGLMEKSLTQPNRAA